MTIRLLTKRKRKGILALKVYGQTMEPYFPEIEKVIADIRNGNPKSHKVFEDIMPAYEYMQKNPMPDDLRSIAPYIEAYEKANNIKRGSK